MLQHSFHRCPLTLALAGAGVRGRRWAGSLRASLPTTPLPGSVYDRPVRGRPSRDGPVLQLLAARWAYACRAAFSVAHSVPLLSCYLLEETPCPPPCSLIRRPWPPRRPPAAPVGPANCGSAPAVSPSRLIPRSAPASGVSLRQLHAGCGEHIEYHKCCPKHGRVPADQIAKGYPVQRRAVRRADRGRLGDAGADRRQDHPPGTLPLPDRIRPDAAGRSQPVPRAGPSGGHEALRRDPPSPAARTNGPSAGPSSPASVNW